MIATTNDEQDRALALLERPVDGPAGNGGAPFEMRPGSGQALHRAISTRLGKVGRKDLLASPPMAALRAVRDGKATRLDPADLRAIEAFARAFDDSTGMLLLSSRFASDSVAAHRARQARASG